MATALSKLKETAFVLWRPANTAKPPALVFGTFQPGNPPTLAGKKSVPLKRLPGHDDLWAVAAADCGLADGQVVHYWFEVTDSSPTRDGRRILCTDPTATTVDWRLLADLPEGPSPSPYLDEDRDPAGVVKFQGGRLVACDAAGEEFAPAERLAGGPANNHLVIYELPTAWAQVAKAGAGIGVGTFRDVQALVDRDAEGANFAGHAVLAAGRSYLGELGANALELLPPADSFVDREWGYATSNYFAPDFDLGFPDGNASPTPNTDLVALVNACHARGVRFFTDVVMAFGTRAPLENVHFDDFHIDPKRSPGDPDDFQSGNQGTRDGFGGKLWRYGHFATTFDPVSGDTGSFVPARQYMKAYLRRWMADFGVDGIRMDSVNNVANWDFVKEYKDEARALWAAGGGADDAFLVVGEELGVPLDLVRQGRLDGLWNEEFKRMIRSAILGRNGEHEPSFEWTVKKIVDCRLLGFRDGAEAVNYVGSHDVGGDPNKRLYNFLGDNGVVRREERVKLAFACLFTAVGIPMVLAGDEFADEHDLGTGDDVKQKDGVNYARLDEPFRQRVFESVSRLAHLRTTYPALGTNDTDFLHVDFDAGKRILAWRRGVPGSDSQVVVVANFSDFDSAHAGSDEYRVPNWPATPAGKRWREVSQGRDVPAEWVGREAAVPWEAKVYALV